MARYRKKPGTGSHYLARGVRMADGAVIECEPSELGNALDKFERLDVELEQPEGPQPTVNLRAVHRGFGHWDVIHPLTGIAVNDKRLTKDEAMNLVGNIGAFEAEYGEDSCG